MDARKAQRTWMCILRVPVDDDVLKIAVGNPKGKLAAKRRFSLVFAPSKHGMDAKPEEQDRATRKKIKPEQQDNAKKRKTSD